MNSRAIRYLMAITASSPSAAAGQEQTLRRVDLIGTYRDMTSVRDEPCPVGVAAGDIVVCSRAGNTPRYDRSLDRPVVRDRDDAVAERSRLLEDHGDPGCGITSNPKGCGFAGVTVKLGM